MKSFYSLQLIKMMKILLQLYCTYITKIIVNSKFKYSETCKLEFLKGLTISSRRIEVDVNEKSYGGAVLCGLRIVY